MGMKLPPELEAEILRRANVGPAARLPGDDGTPAAKPALVEPSFSRPGTWTIPVETASEVNGRDWKARSRRTKAAWRAVSRVLGPNLLPVALVAAAYHRGKAVRCVLTRLGGRRLDRGNLPTALKATEDAVCFLMGVDDGDDRWRCQWDQEPGGPVGVRVTLEIINEGEA